MKVVSIILGILLIIGGAYCILTPIATYSTISWLIGLAMIVEGIGSAITWNDMRKNGFADGWTLAGAIISIILGVFLLGSFAARFAVDLFIAYIIAAWLIIGGIVRIVASIKVRKLDRYEGGSAVGSSWIVLLILGILVVICGVLCMINPLSVMIGVGMMLGISIVCVGVDLFARGLRS